MLDVEVEDSGEKRGVPLRENRNWKQRLRRYLLVFLVAHILLLLLCRMPFWLTQSRIQALGGSTATGLPPIYFKLAITSALPSPLKAFCGSASGRWIFSQWPVIYRVDLRGVSDPEEIRRVLEANSVFGNVTELVLYRSGVEDRHMQLVREGFPQLHSLKVNDTNITDAGVAELQGHPKLRHINLQQTLITDSSLPYFNTMPKLKELNLGETGVTSIQSLRGRGPFFSVTTELVTRGRTTVRIRSGR